MIALEKRSTFWICQAMNRGQIVNYYDQAEVDYRLVWHLGSEMAMHYGFWEIGVKSLSQALQRENQVLAKLAKIKKEDRVLDAGCGVGGSAIFLAKTFGCQIIGVTLSSHQVEMARKNAKKHGVEDLAAFKVMDFSKTNFKNDYFDVVWAIESVCHSPDKKKFVKEACRILKPGGRLAVADGFLTREPSRYSLKEKRLIDQWLRGWGVDFLESPGNFQGYLQSAGFKKISCSDKTKLVMPSAQRLYQYFFPAYLVTKVGELIGLRNKIQTANVMSAYYQYQVLIQGLCQYGIFLAQKGA